MVHLFTFSKQPCLPAISAYEALRQHCGVDMITALRYFKLWEIESTPAIAPETWESILSESYILANPNKEGYSLNTLPPHSHSNINPSCLIRVWPKSHHSDIRRTHKLNTRFSLSICEIKQYHIWELSLKETDLSDTALKQYVTNAIVESKPNGQGLLVNPVSESFELIDPCQYTQ